MSYKLFVGGLPFATTDDELQAAFAEFGEVVSATVVKDRETGRSKGFGFVEFSNDEEGKTAQSKLDGSSLGGRNISVSEARPKEDRPRRSFDGNRGGDRQRSW